MELVNVLVTVIEACAVTVISTGALVAFVRFVWTGLRH